MVNFVFKKNHAVDSMRVCHTQPRSFCGSETTATAASPQHPPPCKFYYLVDTPWVKGSTMALSTALGALGRCIRLLPTSPLPGASCSAAPGLGHAYASALSDSWRTVHVRGIITVNISEDEREDTGIRKVFSIMKEEGYEDKGLSRMRHTGKAEQRKLDKKESAYRLKRREYRRLMKWVMTRKKRWSMHLCLFPCPPLPCLFPSSQVSRGKGRRSQGARECALRILFLTLAPSLPTGGSEPGVALGVSCS